MNNTDTADAQTANGNDADTVDVSGVEGGDFDALFEHSEADAAQHQWCFVIAFHPDTARIGQCSTVPVTQAPLPLGRHSPVFATAGATADSGVDDASVSRRAFCLEAADSHWTLRREPGRSRLRLNGREVSREETLSREQLQRGVVITLAQRVVLHLRLQPQLYGSLNTPRDERMAPLLGVSPAMESLRDSALRASRTTDDVLLVGPTGSGKELVARSIHDLSVGADGPWVAVNMAAMPVDIAPASLFGARRGAYTGADSDRLGYFQQAAGGSLFLDEVGDTPLPLQPVLLRALQEREIQVVGGKTERVDLRVIAAMEQDPDQLKARFRPALRYRLGAQEIRLPALSERREDIGLLSAGLFRALASNDESVWLAGVADPRVIKRWARLFEQFLAYTWPGNVRELQQIVRQISVCSGKNLSVPRAILKRLSDIPGASGSAVIERASNEVKEVPTPRLADISDDEFVAAWRSARYEVAALARDLGVSRAAIYRRLQTLEQCRLAADIPLGELLSVLDSCRGNLAATAERLAVSERGLQTRLRASGVRSARPPDTQDRALPDVFQPG